MYGKLDSVEGQIARAYVRVSRVGTREEKELLSPTLQLNSAREYCRNLKLELDESSSIAYQDLDVSGFSKPWRKRPGLVAHYEAARRGEFEHLVFYTISRLGRNLSESLSLIAAFEKTGVKLHFIKERFDATPEGIFHRNILLAIAEKQSHDTSQFVRDAVIARARAGRLQGGALPCWLERAEDGTICVRPDQREAIRRLIQLRMQGRSYIGIARQLNEEGFRTVSGRPWTDGSSFKYLRDDWIETMLGTGFLNRELPVGHPERVVIHDAFPAILSEDEGNAIKAVQRGYKTAPLVSPIPNAGNWKSNRGKREGRFSAETNYLLSSIVFCACCGSRLQSIQHGPDRPNIYSYLCPRARTNPEAHGESGGVSINAASLEDAVLRVVRLALQMPPAPIVESASRPMPTRRIAQVDEEIDRLVRLQISGRISDTDFNRNYEALSAEKTRLLALEQEVAAPVTRGAAERLASRGDELSRAELRQLVLLMVKSVEAPIYLEGRYVRPGLQTLRRYARVTLHFPTGDGSAVYHSALYTMRYGGWKEAPLPVPASTTEEAAPAALDP